TRLTATRSSHWPASLPGLHPTLPHPPPLHPPLPLLHWPPITRPFTPPLSANPSTGLPIAQRIKFNILTLTLYKAVHAYSPTSPTET
ncbi:unnamed protein product, partial [Staurois parvus]